MTDNAARIARIKADDEAGLPLSNADFDWLIQQAEIVTEAKLVAFLHPNAPGGVHFYKPHPVGTKLYTLPQPACGNENQGEKK